MPRAPYRAPSVRNLMRLPGMTVEDAKCIRASLHKGYAYHALRLANVVMNGHGLEGFTRYRSRNSQVISYVNTGDTYALTLLHNYTTGYTWVGSWGDFVERNNIK